MAKNRFIVHRNRITRRARIDNGTINTKYRDPATTVGEVQVEKSENKIVVTVPLSYSTLNNSTNQITYTLYPTGDLVVNSVFDSKASEMLGRVGMKMELPAGYENITYYGRGPEENYIDRNTGSLIGVYDNTVDGMFVPYMKPQENGNRTDVRWVSLTDEEGDGLLFSADVPMEFGALHYSASELNSKAHPYQLTRSDQILFDVGLHANRRWQWKLRPNHAGKVQGQFQQAVHVYLSNASCHRRDKLGRTENGTGTKGDYHPDTQRHRGGWTPPARFLAG